MVLRANRVRTCLHAPLAHWSYPSNVPRTRITASRCVRYRSSSSLLAPHSIPIPPLSPSGSYDTSSLAQEDAHDGPEGSLDEWGEDLVPEGDAEEGEPLRFGGPE